MSAPFDAQHSTFPGAGIEPEQPTHMLTVRIPLKLDGPFSSVVFRDALNVVLSLARVSNRITADAEATLAEVEIDA